MFRARPVSSPKEGRSNRGPSGGLLPLNIPPSPKGVRHRQRNIWITLALGIFFCLYLINVRSHDLSADTSSTPPDGRKRLYPIVPRPRTPSSSDSKKDADEDLSVRLSTYAQSEPNEEEDVEETNTLYKTGGRQQQKPLGSNKPEVVESKAVIEAKDRKSTRLNSSHSGESRMPSSA